MLFRSGFVNGPAAVSMHHAYRHGLLEHTVRMARAARALLPLYPEISPDLALAGILLHDIGKTLEYQAGMSTRRSRLGILQGHVVLGYRIVRRAGLRSGLDPDLLERLEHIILSHQGELEWGAAAMAATPEAVFVSMVDNLDARMGMVQQALRQSQPGGDPFSEYLPGLKAPLLTQAPPASPTLEDNLEQSSPLPQVHDPSPAEGESWSRGQPGAVQSIAPSLVRPTPPCLPCKGQPTPSVGTSSNVGRRPAWPWRATHPADGHRPPWGGDPDKSPEGAVHLRSPGWP